MQYQSAATINAPADEVWKVLVDTSSWPEWDPFCDRIDGKVALGSKLKVYSKLSPGRGFPIKVTDLTPHERMTWTGGMPFGLFKGIRTFVLEDRGNGTTHFTVSEVFTGPMLALIGKSLPDMTDAFNAHAAGLKERVENSRSSQSGSR